MYVYTQKKIQHRHIMSNGNETTKYKAPYYARANYKHCLLNYTLHKFARAYGFSQVFPFFFAEDFFFL